MGPRTQKTVGDLAYEHGVHEDTVLDFAEDHDVPTLGREFVFESEEERQFEKWLEERDSTEDDDSADAGDNTDAVQDDDPAPDDPADDDTE